MPDQTASPSSAERDEIIRGAITNAIEVEVKHAVQDLSATILLADELDGDISAIKGSTYYSKLIQTFDRLYPFTEYAETIGVQWRDVVRSAVDHTADDLAPSPAADTMTAWVLRFIDGMHAA
jgi:hypothetical protein